MPTFEELSKQRKLLQEFCFAHVPSLEFFLASNFDTCPIFRLDDGESQPTEFRHITSSSTCYTSIAGCPDQFRPERKKGTPDFTDLGQKFAKTAIDLPLDKWLSDGAAHIYCSCRGLPFVLSRLEQWHPRIDEHLERIFYQLNEDRSRFAIGEAAKDSQQTDKAKERKSWYKPNAYHTYWTLLLLRMLDDPKFAAGAKESKQIVSARSHRDQMQAWARQQLAFQVALHSAGSSVLDSDQLAWALAILISQPKEYVSNLAEQDFIRQAFRCLFSTQESVGTWRHYAPLFHYPHVGNAYCYVFETFAAVLSEALRRDAEFVRASLKEYFPQLIRLWQYATSTQAKTEKGERAWSSGHRINPGLESWATASVFEFAQALRRLVGMWTSEVALPTLNHKTPFPNSEKAKEKVLERAQIWTSHDLADRLWTMFINPVGTRRKDELDPDKPLVGEEFPRAAIFFGPPGTSKTKLVSAIAGAIGWKYIELHPSHFVADGLPNVQQTADVIFGKLMELDHAVVLFDEIDELVRERDIEPDQFGRFLTTSMLPRLAELWKARKIMYFVATNHIEYFDRAVIRSERFDAIIFVSPPSFEAKRLELLEILQKVHHIEASFAPDLTRQSVDAVMAAIPCKSLHRAKTKEERDRIKGRPLPERYVLAKFAMLRWDELDELALHVRNVLETSRVITPSVLKQALLKINDSKSRSLGEYCRFQSDPRDYERSDASRQAVWIVEEIEGFTGGNSEPPKPVYKIGESYAINAPVGPIWNVRVVGFRVEPANSPEAGRIRLKKV